MATRARLMVLAIALVALIPLAHAAADAACTTPHKSPSGGPETETGDCRVGPYSVDGTKSPSLVQRATNPETGQLASGEKLELKTVGWKPNNLLGVRKLLQGVAPPTWASRAQYALLRQARRVVNLPSGLRPGVPPGPWSPVNKSTVPPSGDKRDYHSIGVYYWPCTATCEDTGYNAEQCKSWDRRLRRFGPCDAATGLPWVNRDGFFNPAGQQDLMALIVMADTVETLTLAWWFSSESEESLTFARTAALLIRTWFLDEATRQNPRMEYADAIPGYRNGSAGGVIAPTFRLNTRLSDCVELLRAAGAEVWSDADTEKWKQWATAWYTWLRTSEFGQIEMGAIGNHATYLFLHKLAMASTTEDTAAILEEVKTLRRGLAGSLSAQILPSGEMPIETARTIGATYTRMNLEALFKLGVAVETVCHGLECSPEWDWSWEVTSRPSPRWEKYSNNISYCNYRGRGSTESVEQCQASCLASEKVCNGVVTRQLSSTGKVLACYFKECKGEMYKLREQAIGRSVFYDTFVRVDGPPVGSGSVKKALDFVLPYALHDKNWADDFPHCIDASHSWKTLALPLRIARTAFDDSKYEDQIARVDPDGRFQLSANALLFPPSGALAP